MLLKQARILNFDNSLTRQKKLLSHFNPKIVDLRAFSSACRHWMSRRTAGKIKSVLDPRDRNVPTFIGSGDYHHISGVLIRQFQQPLTLIVFDFHPDLDIMPPRLGCGSWMSSSLEMDNIKKAILIGVSSDDISAWRIQSADLGSLKNSRLEIYPWQHRPTTVVLRKVADNASFEVKRGRLSSRIHWQELKDGDLSVLFGRVLERIPTAAVYISIDKDCLRRQDALTNWEEGAMGLDNLLFMLGLIKERFDIAGLDISGEYSPPDTKNILKRISLALDHPKDYSACANTQESIDRVNEDTNIKILELLNA